MGKLKLALITPGTFPIPSARSSSVETVVEQVALRLKERLDVTVYGRRGEAHPKRELLSGITYRRPSSRPGAVYIRKVAERLSRHKPDLIQVENRPRFVRYLRRKFPRLPIWLFLHSTTFISPKHISPKELKTCLGSADKIIVNSHFLKEQLLQTIPEKEASIAVNHLGVDMASFVSRWTPEGMARKERLMKLMDCSGKKVILYVGRLIEMKGVHHILQAMPRIADRVPEALLVVVGGAFYGSNRTTPYVRKLHRQGKAMGERVQFVPYVPHDRIQDWFGMADVVLVPSENREAFGLVNLEAMSCGVPVIATRAGGMREVIQHGLTGLLIPAKKTADELAESTIRLLNDPELLRVYGEQSVRRVREFFTWEAMAERWLKLAEEGLGRGKLRRIEPDGQGMGWYSEIIQ